MPNLSIFAQPKFLRIKVKGVEAEIRGLEFSINFHLNNGGTEDDQYIKDCRSRLEEANSLLLAKQTELRVAELSEEFDQLKKQLHDDTWNNYTAEEQAVWKRVGSLLKDCDAAIVARNVRRSPRLRSK